MKGGEAERCASIVGWLQAMVSRMRSQSEQRRWISVIQRRHGKGKSRCDLRPFVLFDGSWHALFIDSGDTDDQGT